MAEKADTSIDTNTGSDGAITKKMFKQWNTAKYAGYSLEEIEAVLDPNFVPAGWLDPDPEPPKKKQKLNLSISKKTLCKPTSSRFATPISEEEFSDAAKGVIPCNTKKNNSWAERTFNAWVAERNRSTPGSVPTDLLLCRDPATVCKYMRYFVLEARSHDGNKYPPGTIRSILSGLN